MSDKKQCSEHMNNGIGTSNKKYTPNDPKAPTLTGGTVEKGVPSPKKG